MLEGWESDASCRDKKKKEGKIITNVNGEEEEAQKQVVESRVVDKIRVKKNKWVKNTQLPWRPRKLTYYDVCARVCVCGCDERLHTALTQTHTPMMRVPYRNGASSTAQRREWVFYINDTFPHGSHAEWEEKGKMKKEKKFNFLVLY